MANEELLQQYLDDVEALSYDDNTHLDRIRKRGLMLIRNIFGKNSPYLSNLGNIRFRAYSRTGNTDYQKKWNEGKQELINLVNVMIEELTLFQKDITRNTLEKQITQPKNNKVFIVHGHDSELKNDAERFVHEIGLEPIVLHRQVDKGSTIIEKFEENSDVGFVFVLLTPDEITYTVDQAELQDEEREKELRARPNVIFEFGYFVGKLGRERVCCLHKGDIVVPSDLSGLIYKKVDDSIESQAYQIIKELKAAGFDVKI